MFAVSDNLKGALAMMAAMAGFTLGDSAIKSIGTALPFFETIFLRGILATLPLAVLVWWTGHFGAGLARRDWFLMMVRMAAEAVGTWFFINALYRVELGTLTAILQSLPLTVTLAAALFLGEPVGWRRMLAIMVGFVGVLIIIRPGGAAFSSDSLYGLATVACVTLRDLVVRKMSSDTPTLLAALVTAAGVMVFGGIGALTEPWQAVELREAVLLLACAGAIVVGYIGAVTAMRIGEISFVAPFRYTSILVAIIAGWAIFSEIPDVPMIIGTLIVVGTGLFTLYREQRVQQELPGADSHRNLPFALTSGAEELAEAAAQQERASDQDGRPG